MSPWRRQAATLPPAASPADAGTLAESQVVACLQESFVRGLLRVTDAIVVEMDTKYLNESATT